jgi:hypothetical protein
MTFLTGTASDPTDLLQQFKTFITGAPGWTIDNDAAQVSGRILAISKGAKHVSLRSFLNENLAQMGGAAVGAGIAMTMYTTYALPSPTTHWWDQAGAPFVYNQIPVTLTAICTLAPGPTAAYWFFADAAGDNIVLVAFRSAGVYNHLYFGDMVKPAGQTWTGGVYFGGSSPMVTPFAMGPGNTQQGPPPGGMTIGNPCAFLKADVDSWTAKWVSLTNQRAPATIVATGKAMMSTAHNAGGTDEAVGEHVMWGDLRLRAKSSLTAGILTLPVFWLVERDFAGAVSGGGWSLAGQVPNVFQTTADGYVPGAQYDISTDHYIVFPTFAVRKF